MAKPNVVGHKWPFSPEENCHCWRLLINGCTFCIQEAIGPQATTDVEAIRLYGDHRITQVCNIQTTCQKHRLVDDAANSAARRPIVRAEQFAQLRMPDMIHQLHPSGEAALMLRDDGSRVRPCRQQKCADPRCCFRNGRCNDRKLSLVDYSRSA